MERLGLDDLRRMQELSRRITAIDPAMLNADSTVGELAWVWSKDVVTLGDTWRHRIWTAGSDVVAFGWARLPYRVPLSDGRFRESKEAMLSLQVHPDHVERFADVLDWYDDVASGHDRLLILQTGGVEPHDVALDRGYESIDDDDWIRFNARPLDEIEEPSLPEGFRFVDAAGVSLAAAIAVHRASWRGWPFPESDFARVQSTWPYRLDLHVFVEAPDGELASSATIWFDDATKTAEFEPVGTHPDHRRKGLGRALQLHGMHQAKAAGAETMLVACQGSDANGAARDLYESVGFREISRDLTFFATA